MKGAKLWLKQASPTILSYAAVAGLIATTVTAVKVTPDAVGRIEYDSRFNHDGDSYAYTKLEAFKSAWRCYIPAVAIGVSTVACILGANALNKRQQAALTSAYMLLNNAHKEFIKKDKDAAVRKAIVDETAKPIDISSTEKALFYEFNYGELFERDIVDVLSAEYKLNQQFVDKGYACLNDFYELVGLPKTDIGETLGWTRDDDILWVDFEHELVELEDGMECYLINLPEPPIPTYICPSRKLQTALWKGGTRI